ncbi:MAG: cyclic nucleotide-binding domain-containing protein [Desulfamplus sp.]|nr:cyclic nucleotide-binding domain-containing protein [Desulfamplus sp.]
METKSDILKKCFLFSTASDTYIDAISRIAISQYFQEGEVLAIKGEAVNFFFVLQAGMLMVDLDGEKALILQKEGDFAGFEILSRDHTLCSTVTALTDGKALFIKRDDFMAMLGDNPQSSEQIMQLWKDHAGHTFPFLEDTRESQNSQPAMTA